MSATATRTKGTWGGRREGAGAKPLTPEQRLERSITARAAASEVLRGAAGALLDAVGLDPRRRLLLGEPVVERTSGPWMAEAMRLLCRQTIGPFAGQPLEIEPWQQAFVDDALAFDDDGRLLYPTALLGIPRKCGKTTLCAGASIVWASPLSGEGKPTVVHAAGSKEQAGPLSTQTADFALGHPLLELVFDVARSGITCPANGGTIDRVAGDGKLNHGLNIWRLVADELHAWMTPRQRENWAALTTADGARDDALSWIISTAGYDLTTILGELFLRASRSPLAEPRPDMGDAGFVLRDPAAGLLVHWYGIAADTPLDDVAAWKRANPASWRTVERLARDLAREHLDEGTKRRLYGNQWTAAREAWIRRERWAELADREATDDALEDGSVVAVAADASLSHDTTAIAWAAHAPGGKIAVRCRVFSVRRDAPAHRVFDGSTIDLGEVERFIAGQRLHPDAPPAFDLCSTYRVRTVAFDPRYFIRSAQLLNDQDVETTRYEPQGQETWAAVQGFYNLVADGRLVHDGDEVLAAHVEAAAGVRTDRGWKVSKLRASAPIDGLIAVILAVDALVNLPEDSRPKPFALTY